MMQGRLSGRDMSLNAPQTNDADSREWLELSEDDTEQAADRIERSNDLACLKTWLSDAMTGLTDRERKIIRERKLSETPATLEALGHSFGISKERVRQLEAGAIEKMRSRLEISYPEAHALIA